MKNGDYLDALSLYKKIKAFYNTTAFDLNIRICERKIEHSTSQKQATSTSPLSSSTTSEYRDQKICLIRVIGNDLPGLHGEGQSYSNLEFILRNEPDFSNVDKIFIINNLVSDENRNKIKQLLDKHKKEYFENIFDPEEYINIPWNTDDMPDAAYWQSDERTEWDFLCGEALKRKKKNAYLMNNNGARNLAINIGFSKGYDWVLPFDGNCFFSKKQFDELSVEIYNNKNADYLIIPMERCLENNSNLATKESKNATEEPQIAFKNGATLKFDENRVYGNQPKVDLLKRLGVPGIWDKWVNEYPWKPFELKKENLQPLIWKISSSVFRLASGNESATVNSNFRANARAKAIINLIDNVYIYCQEVIKNKSTIDYEYYSHATKKSESPEKIAHRPNDIFNQIYVVSLEKDTEKRLKVQNQLLHHGIKYANVTAINGYQGASLKKYNDYIKRPIGDLKKFSMHANYEKKKKKKLIESPGAMGYIHTYISILKDAKNNGFKNILILEDDIIFSHDFISRFDNFIKNIKSDWKVLHLGASQYGWANVDWSRSLKKGFYHPTIHDTKGSFAIGLNESIYDELIDNQMAFEAPFDNLPIGVLYEKYKDQCFVAFPYLVMPDVSVSNIREKRDQRSHANRVRWWVGDFAYPQKKLNVGVILTSKKNVKYLHDINILDNAPYKVSYFYISENGVLPIHDFHNFERDNFKPFSEESIKGRNISVDFLFKIPEDHCLTEESLLEAIEACLNGSSDKIYFQRLSTEDSKIVTGRVSVIIPTYKRSVHLKAAMESVLSQDYKDIELIVVDDNGMDLEFKTSTQNIVRECIKKYPNKSVQYIQHKINANGATARNTGILYSTGEYISFLDDDDIYLPGRISKSIAVLKYSNEDCGGVYCGFLGWNSKSLDENRFATGDLTKELLSLDYKKHYLHTDTATYKRSAIFRINGFDQSYQRHQDLEFNLRFFKEYTIDAIKECLVRLSPEKNFIDNKIYDIQFFDLKCKFLSKFKSLIDNLDETERKNIYMKHWHEVIRYSKNPELLLNHIKNDFSNGALQIELMSQAGNNV